MPAEPPAGLVAPESLTRSLTASVPLAVASRGASFARGLVFARLLDSIALGVWALAINAALVAAQILVMGVPSGHRRFIERYARGGDLAPLLTRSIGAALVVAGTVASVAMIARARVGQALFGDAATDTLVGLTVAAGLASVALMLVKGVLQGLRLFRVEGFVELTFNCGFLLAAVALLLTWRRDAVATAVAYLAFTLVAVVLGGAVARRAVRERVAGATRTDPAASGSSRPSATPAGATRFARYAAGSWAAMSVLLLWQTLDRYMLLHLGTLGLAENLRAVGDYFIAVKLVAPLEALGGVLALALVPHTARAWENGARREVERAIGLAAKIALLALTVNGGLIVLAHRPLVALIVGRVPEGVSLVMGPVMVTTLAMTLYYVVRCYLLCRERVWLTTWVGLVALVLGVSLNVILIPRLHLLGAAYATLGAAAFTALATTGLAWREGLSLDRGWLACGALPAALLLPVPAMIGVLALVLAAVVATNQVLDADEKHRVWTWLEARGPTRAVQAPEPAP